MRHLIIMSSSYSSGCRIALDFCPGELKTNEFERAIAKIKDVCGADVSISSHSIEAEGASWQDVGKADMFFADVKLIKTLDEFISLVKADRKLTGWDVAKYILSKVRCTHLKLEKLVYLAYADYLCVTGDKKLFEDKILAYMYGPIVCTVYSECKRFGYDEIDGDGQLFSARKYDELPVRSRILFAEGGFDKCLSIDKTIERYGRFEGGQLIDITHRCGSPWQHTAQSAQISDDDILKYHYIEKV